MTLKSDAKLKEKFALQWALFVQSISGLTKKNTEKLSFMTLSSDAKFE